MKRYRILQFDFDTRALILTTQIGETWEEQAKTQMREHQTAIRYQLARDFGIMDAEAKIQNFIELGPAPLSVLAYHNQFLNQIRRSFVIGGYYPALTGACALGERILNHLVLSLRDAFKATPAYKEVYRKKSIDDWGLAIRVLASWKVLQPDSESAFLKLKDIRNRVIHFDPATDRQDRELALTAIKTLVRIIESQFSAFGMQPWFIRNTPGVSFLTKTAENDPFIKSVYIPNCQLVGPFHRLKHSDSGWIVDDEHAYETREISDEEFAELHNDRSKHPNA